MRALQVLQSILGEEEAAALIGVDAQEVSSQAHRERVEAAAEVVQSLQTPFEPAVIPGWFRAPRLSGGRSPGDLLRLGRYDEVRAEVAAALGEEMS